MSLSWFMYLDACSVEQDCVDAVIYPRGSFTSDAGVVSVSVFRASDQKRYLQLRVIGYSTSIGSNPKLLLLLYYSRA